MTNNSISRLTFAAAFLAVAATGAHRVQAQAPTLPRSQAEFEQQMGFTADQKAMMLKINKKYQPKFMLLQQKYKPQFDAIQQQVNEIRKRYAAEATPLQTAQKKELDALLTPAQKQKIAQIQAAQETQMRAQYSQGAGKR